MRQKNSSNLGRPDLPRGQVRTSEDLQVLGRPGLPRGQVGTSEPQKSVRTRRPSSDLPLGQVCGLSLFLFRPLVLQFDSF